MDCVGVAASEECSGGEGSGLAGLGDDIVVIIPYC